MPNEPMPDIIYAYPGSLIYSEEEREGTVKYHLSPNQEDLAEKLLKEYKEALWDATLHFTMKTFSTRPCSTCNTVSKLIGKDFGCVKLSRRQGGS